MSSSLEDRFARLAALKPTRKHAAAQDRLTAGGSDEFDRLAQLLGGVVGRNRYGEHLVVRRWYSSPEPCEPSAHALRLLAPATPVRKLRKGERSKRVGYLGTGSAPAQYASDALERMADPAEWLFLDTETTGLAGGTGTYAFLVGLAWWEAGGLQVEQVFMRDYSEEHSLLLELARRMAERRVLVTFNGKSFDWPLLETRYTMTRAIKPQTPVAHLDLLHPARQLWRLRLGSVRLTELERRVLGSERLGWHRRDDIDSALIPQIYFDYLRGGPVEPVASVFRHNQMDLRGLAALTGKIVSLLSQTETAEASDQDALELFGLSRLLHRRGETARARLLYECVLRAGLPSALDRAARRELALLAKGERDFIRATSLWEEQIQKYSGSSESRGVGLAGKFAGALHLPRAEVVGAKHALPLHHPYKQAGDSDDGFRACLEAYEHLAMYYEHQAREHSKAAELTREALAAVRRALRACPERGPGVGWIDLSRWRKLQGRLEHRLARLIRKSRRPLLEPDFPEARGNPNESNQEPRKGGQILRPR